MFSSMYWMVVELCYLNLLSFRYIANNYFSEWKLSTHFRTSICRALVDFPNAIYINYICWFFFLFFFPLIKKEVICRDVKNILRHMKFGTMYMGIIQTHFHFLQFCHILFVNWQCCSVSNQKLLILHVIVVSHPTNKIVN